jgi:hypothetical protein
LVEGAIFVFDRHVKAMKALRDVRGKCGLPDVAARLGAYPWLFAGVCFAEEPFFLGICMECTRNDLR